MMPWLSHDYLSSSHVFPILGFSQSWSSGHTQSAQSFKKKSEPDAWPKMGQHLRFSWNGHGEMENLRKDFTRNFSSEHCNMGECLPSKNSYLSKMMWFSTMLVFLGRNYMRWLGFPKSGLYPRLRWCSLPKPSAPWGWGDKSHEFAETSGTTKQLWLLSLKVMICPAGKMPSGNLT